MAIRRCLPERLQIAAHTRTATLINAPMCIVAFIAVSYKHRRHKRLSERVHTRFGMHLSGEIFILTRAVQATPIVWNSPGYEYIAP